MLFGLKKFISYWLMPLPFSIVAILAGLLLLRFAKRARFGRVLLVVGLAVLVLTSNKLVSRWLIRPLETRYPAMPEFTASQPAPGALAECRFVIVLGSGHGMSPDMAASNLLGTSAVSRIVEGVRILRVLPAAKLIVTGPGADNQPSHAAILGRSAESMGVEGARILRLEQVRDTEDEVNAIRQIIGDTPVALVTSGWHMPRAMALARSVGLRPVACPCDYRSHASDMFALDDLFWEVDALGRSTLAVRERIGYVWIWLRGKT